MKKINSINYYYEYEKSGYIINVFIFPVFKINNLILNLNIFYFFILWTHCTCKTFTKFIINEINKDNFIKIENILVNNYKNNISILLYYE